MEGSSAAIVMPENPEMMFGKIIPSPSAFSGAKCRCAKATLSCVNGLSVPLDWLRSRYAELHEILISQHASIFTPKLPADTAERDLP